MKTLYPTYHLVTDLKGSMQGYKDGKPFTVKFGVWIQSKKCKINNSEEPIPREYLLNSKH